MLKFLALADNNSLTILADLPGILMKMCPLLAQNQKSS